MKKTKFLAEMTYGEGVVVSGWGLTCGLVVHRSFSRRGWGMRDDSWTVSDPECGCSVTSGASMSDAVSKLRQLQGSYGSAFDRVIALKRVCMRDMGSGPLNPHWSESVSDWPEIHWEEMKTAPRRGGLTVRGKSEDGTIFDGMHWASDLSGQDQPPYEGWFMPYEDDCGFYQVRPIRWQPMEVQP